MAELITEQRKIILAILRVKSKVVTKYIRAYYRNCNEKEKEINRTSFGYSVVIKPTLSNEKLSRTMNNNIDKHVHFQISSKQHQLNILLSF